MKKIETQELESINGGSASIGVVGIVTIAITAITVFASGIFKGYTTPEGCNE